MRKRSWLALGGGPEYAVTGHVMIRAEALYFDLGSISLNAAAPEFADVTMDVDQRVAGIIVRAGISYKF